MYEKHPRGVQACFLGGEAVIFRGIGPAGEVSAHAEVGDGDPVVLKMERHEASDLSHRSVPGESPVHLRERERERESRCAVCVAERRVSCKKIRNHSMKRRV